MSTHLGGSFDYVFTRVLSSKYFILLIYDSVFVHKKKDVMMLHSVVMFPFY